ncbi:ectoine/hydroxyectoine ABC transporter permease subunit EhuD [Alphaproteobacteria bacterium]|nr:ectoine/hydroxyectoine ABC transporter permease subunit EhuD [Alphaproteobacteria bacterium]
MDWDWELTLDVIIPRIIEASWVTIYVTIISFVLSLIGGIIFMILKTSKIKLISIFSTEFIELIRSTPLLIQIFFIFFGLPKFGITLTPVVSGIIAFSLYNSTLCAEVYRSGLNAIPRGQWEACTALNLSFVRSFFRIVFPQMLVPIIPALGNFLVAIFKETPILSFVAVAEVMHVAKLIGYEYYEFTEAITTVGILFIILSLISAKFISMTENYVRKSVIHE